MEQDTGRMVIEIVPNRKIETMIAYISKHVFVGSLVITDRYPSYIQAVKNAISSHEFVNHSRRFKRLSHKQYRRPLVSTEILCTEKIKNKSHEKILNEFRLGITTLEEVNMKKVEKFDQSYFLVDLKFPILFLIIFGCNTPPLVLTGHTNLLLN
ncbi:hypothetical protein NGRA_0382 [Nosema granulosis]|uniref:ISXO2-like transposase domain-containing protein n=1 Tax=Nosema granulosis TaxID=83296 RepID=A0A9P6H0F9_9MICR|nr:hypothetical protein NGRA_0382 [Nosema granulosis]